MVMEIKIWIDKKPIGKSKVKDKKQLLDTINWLEDKI